MCSCLCVCVWLDEEAKIVRVLPEFRMQNAEWKKLGEGKALQDVVVIVQWIQPNNKSAQRVGGCHGRAVSGAAGTSAHSLLSVNVDCKMVSAEEGQHADTQLATAGGCWCRPDRHLPILN